MSSLYLIAFLGLALANDKNSSSGDYTCKNGVYSTLSAVTEDCRAAAYTPYLNQIRKTRTFVSGNDVVGMFNGYCRAVNSATNCTENFVNFLPCLKSQMKSFREMNRLSNWFCNGSKVRGLIEDMYSSLPSEDLNYKTNECYRIAARKQYHCIKQYLNVAAPPTDKQEEMRLRLQSLPCLFKELRSKCSNGTSLLLATLQYDSLIIPPALGINVSDILLTAANLV